MFQAIVFGLSRRRECRLVLRAAQFSSLMLLISVPALRAQSPGPAAAASSTPASTPSTKASSEKTPPGLVPGWTGQVGLEGSTSSDGDVMDLNFGAGYNLSRHFGAGLEVPYYFIGTPSSIKTANPGAVSGNGIGSVTLDLNSSFPGSVLNYGSTLAIGAPTGDEKKGLSTGHATWNFSNHFDHAWGDFTPFADAGVGNTIPDSLFFKRPFMTFGYNATFDGGTKYDLGPFTFSARAYDVAPWGDQTEISRIFRCTSAVKCSATGTSKDRRGFKTTSVQKGGASLTRDNGFNAGVSVNLHRYLDLEVGYTRSVPLDLNIFTFGISVDLAALARSSRQH